MSEIDTTSALTDEKTVKGPTVVHEGRYRLYEKPDGGMHLVYKRDDRETEEHMELPGQMIRLAKMASEGNMSFPQFMREAVKMRNGA